MKNLKKIVLVVALLFLLVPFINVNAEEKEKINIYLFKGDGCPNCENEQKFFESIKDEYGSKYNLKEYEVWYNEENAALLEEVARALDKEIGGVPFLVIGKNAIVGYDEATGEEIKKAIDAEYESKERYDVMDEIGQEDSKKKESNEIISILVVVGVVAVLGGFIFVARKSTK